MSTGVLQLVAVRGLDGEELALHSSALLSLSLIGLPLLTAGCGPPF